VEEEEDEEDGFNLRNEEAIDLDNVPASTKKFLRNGLLLKNK